MDNDLNHLPKVLSRTTPAQLLDKRRGRDLLPRAVPSSLSSLRTLDGFVNHGQALMGSALMRWQSRIVTESFPPPLAFF
ncbi:hypothetical protein M419DRAFT_8993 [Trichoderma reesei RUT C-30]|uniref:Uncharacterized protein n=1 Tax=Hypocrea jecorina (strain ATCC 56765 / BCRC 32924 / NRRL 11460 / Rut C-30) TaxID=1344414 RepID=A0A024S8Q8_HYPJR|nr:hypothetical protein M419DRAFT_8993 [Trichoderma reesei RUT C-30]